MTSLVTLPVNAPRRDVLGLARGLLYPRGMKTLTAKYPGTCAACGNRFEAGAEIAWEPKRALHAACRPEPEPTGHPGRGSARLGRFLARRAHRAYATDQRICGQNEALYEMEAEDFRAYRDGCAD